MTYPDQSDFGDLELRSLAALLARQSRVIVYSFGAVIALAAAFLFVMQPKFTATALVYVNPEQANIMDRVAEAQTSTGSENARIDSEVEILRSQAVALSVIAALDLMSDPEFAPRDPLLTRAMRKLGIAVQGAGGDTLLARTIASFSGALDVRRRGLTYLIAVSVESASPARAAELANAVVETYIDQQVATKINASLAARDILRNQIEAARAGLADSERAFDDFVLRNIGQIDIVAEGERMDILGIDLERNRQSLTEATSTRDIVRAQMEQQDWSGLAGTLGDQALAAMEAESRRLREALVAPASPLDEAELRRQLAGIQASIDAKSGEQLAALEAEIRALEQDATGIRGELRHSLASAELSPRVLSDLYALQQDSGLAREQYQLLAARLRDIETQARIQIADSRVVSAALPPEKPSRPRPLVVILGALALAGMLGTGLAFLNEYYIGGVTSANQLSQISQSMTVATVPLTGSHLAGQMSAADEVVDYPLSHYAESYRELRAMIDQSLRRMQPAQALMQGAAQGTAQGAAIRPGSVILVTSAVPQEGKTSAALALARTYAMAGKRALLVDADLRQPDLHRHLGIEPRAGLIDYLRKPKRAELTDAIYARDPGSALAVLLGAGASETATDQLLNSAVFDMLIEQARAVYDVVVIDTPPLLAAVDARYVAHLADAIVFVTRWAATSQSDLRNALMSLRLSMRETTVLMPLLNGAEISPKREKYKAQVRRGIAIS